jgi:methyltransferase (TIGR00027 family)
MEEGRPSTTARIAAMIRAAHLLWDDAPTILQDPLGLGLSGVESPGALQATLRTIRAEPSNYAGVLVRQRYAEDALATAMQRGVGQYVILGAGLDAFAYRRPDLATLLRVYEVDHPATQQWKRARLRELAVPLPSNLTCIPLDFEQHTLADGLHAGGHRPALPTFVSWLGVTHYLTEEAVITTLRSVASLAPRSEIVLQYFLPEALFDDENRRLLALWKARRASVGEPVLKPVRADHLGLTHAGVGIHAGLGRRTRGIGRALLCGAHGWAPCFTPSASHASARRKRHGVRRAHPSSHHTEPRSHTPCPLLRHHLYGEYPL